MEIRKAKKEEIDEIVAIYKSLIGYEGCLWNEYYPAREDVENDINDDALYILKDDNVIKAVAYAGIDKELFLNKCFPSNMRNPRELARVAVRPDFQKQGLAKVLIKYIEKELYLNGIDYIVLTAGKTNEKALKLYKALGYEICGKTNDHGYEMMIHKKCIID